MLVTVSGIVTSVRDVQVSNAQVPMLVTPSGITMLFSALQSQNVLSQICWMPLGIRICSSEEHLENAPSAMQVTLYGMFTVFRE